MRVVAGSVKGFELRAPRGRGTRPTSDKVRDAIFNVLGESVVDARVLDLFAGTGALAIEALSRGAREAVLVESAREACATIRGNLERTGFNSAARVLAMPVNRALSRLEGRFDIVLLDPPYASSGIDALMSELGEGDVPASGASVVLEHDKRFAPANIYGKLRHRRAKRYGDTSVSFYEPDWLTGLVAR
jgi:16S rRNA (guanine(966)-N(2))-methyltransferase RsmD